MMQRPIVVILGRSSQSDVVRVWSKENDNKHDTKHLLIVSVWCRPDAKHRLQHW